MLGEVYCLGGGGCSVRWGGRWVGVFGRRVFGRRV